MPFVDPTQQPFVRPRSCGHLPHLYKPGGTYFITARLYDAVIPRVQPEPAPLVPDSPDSLDEEDIDPAELMADYDPPLTLGSCALGRPAVAQIVQESLLFYDGVRYDLRAWCIMPNHVHLVLRTRDDWMPDQVLGNWKGYTARQANSLLSRRGTFWEAESFDHLIRAARLVERFMLYTELNPVAAGLCAATVDWPFSSRSYGKSQGE